jgi:predicted KAP-like P-loop ATPase
MENFFKPDNPNADGSEKDLLHREAYTEKLVKVLPTREMSESLIIGINGAWGSGKTFLKNKVIKALGKEDRIFEFNPWEWSHNMRFLKPFLVSYQVF